jgi:alpha-tubulin suppressor-like RCC1 family protein
VVYAVGYNNDGQLGIGSQLQAVGSTSTPTLVTSNRTFVSAAAGLAHTLFIASDGALYAAGNNDYHQLGEFVSTVSRDIPVAVMGTFAITQVAAGAYHTLFLTSSGRVYAAGWNLHGAPRMAWYFHLIFHLFTHIYT